MATTRRDALASTGKQIEAAKAKVDALLAKRVAPRAKPKPRPVETGKQLGRQAARAYSGAVDVAGKAVGTPEGRQAAQIANSMIAGALVGFGKRR